jgi:ABC-type transport system involved in multi-copper enzyme maturation permease subunit
VIALLRSELLRIRSRRLVWILAALALAGILLAVTIAAAKSHPPSGAFPGSQHTFELAHLPDVLRGTAFLMIVIGLVIGASSTGADWQTGSMTTLLTWEPRRARVLVVRTVSVVTAVVVLIVTLSLVLSGLLWLVATTRGSTTGTGGPFLQHVAGLILRVAIMSALGSILGLSISMIGRGTAASLGAIFVYLAVLETLFRSLIPTLTPYLFATNTVVFVDGHAGSPATATVITMTRATITVLAYGVALLVVAWAFFRSRDVN